ncbi:MAG: hypothetical protein MK116_12790 [Phycisphaerales bacterium]|nr:hypothetical protein [Phycisphaerales bacterium]
MHMISLTTTIICTTASMGLAQNICDSDLTPAEARLARNRQDAGAYSMRAGPVQPVVISVAWHVLETTDGRRAIEDDELQLMIDYLNDQWETVNISFAAHPLVDRIVNDVWWDDVPDANELRSMRRLPNALNIYWAPSLEGGGLCGRSSFTFSTLDTIVMQSSCLGYTDVRGVFAHEVGHWFDLFHTFETATGVECVARTNCLNTGDLLCDTPASFGLQFTTCVDPITCNRKPGSFCNRSGPCPGDPLYDPSTTNFMSYSVPPCISEFTPGQYERMRSTTDNLRSDYANTGLHDPCPADIDGSLAVGANDVLALLDAYGPCSDDCESDITGDGQTDVNDVLVLLGAWGPCFSCTDANACDDGDPGTLDYCLFGTCTHEVITGCAVGEIPDCNGHCVPAAWVGDGVCDDGSFTHDGLPVFLNCDAFNCDGGDCICP